MSERVDPDTRVGGGAAVTDKPAAADPDVELLGQLGYTQELARSLRLFASFALQFSLISIGGGLFLTFGYGLTTAGPAFIWAFVIGGLLQMSVALSIAEVASAFPLAASAFSWVRRLYSNGLAWFVGWVLIIGHIAAAASINFGLAPYLLNFFGVSEPATSQIILVAVALVTIQVVLSIFSVRLSAILNNTGVVAELIGFSTIVILLLVLGLVQGPAVLTDTAGTAAASGGSFILPFLLALLVPAWTISSFDATCNLGEETHNAARTVPKGSMIACVGSYVYGIIIIAVVLMAAPNLGAAAAQPLPLEYIMQQRFGFVGATIAEAVLLTGLFVAAMMLTVTGARMLWGQARDGAFPAAGWLHRLNAGRVPANATIVAGVIAILFCLSSNALAVIAALTALAWASAYGVTVAVVLYGKFKGLIPENRGWNLGKWGIANDIVALLWSIALVVLLPLADPPRILGGMAVVIGVGLAIYFGYVRKHWNPEPLPVGQEAEPTGPAQGGTPA